MKMKFMKFQVALLPILMLLVAVAVRVDTRINLLG